MRDQIFFIDFELLRKNIDNTVLLSGKGNTSLFKADLIPPLIMNSLSMNKYIRHIWMNFVCFCRMKSTHILEL